MMDDLLSTLALSDEMASDEAGVDDTAASERKALRQMQKRDKRFNRPVKKRKAPSQRTHRPAPPTSPAAISAESNPTSPPVVAKEARAALFAEWLLRHFGERLMRGESNAAAGTQVAEWSRRSTHSLFIFPSYLDPTATHQPSTAGVVDVAGGKGHLAYLLSTVYHIPTTVIDPRPLNLTRYQTQYAHRLSHMRKRHAQSESALSSVVVPPVPPVPSSDGCHLMTHFRCYFPASVPVTHIPHSGTSSSPLYSDPSDPLTPPPPHSANSANTATPTQQPTVHSFVDPSLKLPLSAECPSVPLLHSYLIAATLLIGFHADGATEAIVEFALQHRKPFAVVPCCVFCNHGGGERTLSDALSAALSDDVAVESVSEQRAANKRRVRSYEDFIAYLLAKDERIRQHTLPFQGRALVLYMDAAAYDVP